MRVLPRSIFFAVVAVGLPFAVSIGWTMGEPPSRHSPALPVDHGGAAGIGVAPTRTTAPRPPADTWTPTPPQRMSVDAPAQTQRPVTRSPSARPSITATDLPAPTMTVSEVSPPPSLTEEPSTPTPEPSTSPQPESTSGLLPLPLPGSPGWPPLG